MPKINYFDYLSSREWGLKRRQVLERMTAKEIMDDILHQYGLLGGALAGLREALEGAATNLLSEVVIRADTSQDAYSLIRSKLGPSSLECPELWSSNHPGSRHITQLAGGPTGAFFRFFIHPQDGDKADGDGRPRNEIKGDGNSPDTVKGFEGDIMRFHWYFRISAGYSKGRNLDSEHILHQQHSTGVNGPIIKYEMRSERLAISHDPDNHGPETNLASTPVGPLLRQWLECEEIIRFSNNGYLKETVRNEAGR